MMSKMVGKNWLKTMVQCTYLNSLVLEWFVRIVYVLECDAVELSLVDVCDAVVLAPLRAAARRLQVVLETVRRKPASKHALTNIVSSDRTRMASATHVVYDTLERNQIKIKTKNS